VRWQAFGFELARCARATHVNCGEFGGRDMKKFGKTAKITNFPVQERKQSADLP
jgi:hypothetical protein